MVGGTYRGGGGDFTSSSQGQMDTETGASICLPFAAAAADAPPTPVPVVVDPVAGPVGTVSQGHTEQLALASECTSNVSASVFTDSLEDGRGTEGRKERKEMVTANVGHSTKTLLYRNNKKNFFTTLFPVCVGKEW